MKFYIKASSVKIFCCFLRIQPHLLKKSNFSVQWSFVPIFLSTSVSSETLLQMFCREALWLLMENLHRKIQTQSVMRIKIIRKLNRRICLYTGEYASQWKPIFLHILCIVLKTRLLKVYYLTHERPILPSKRNQFTDIFRKSTDWFLQDRNLFIRS